MIRIVDVGVLKVKPQFPSSNIASIAAFLFDEYFDCPSDPSNGYLVRLIAEKEYE